MKLSKGKAPLLNYFIRNKSAVLRVLASIFLFQLPLQKMALAQTHKGISFQAQIKLPSGELPTRSGITVNGRILSLNNCILREEQFTGINISNGYINLSIGTNTPSGYDPGLSLKQLMNNSATITGLTCLNADGSINAGVTTYDPSGSSGARKFRISLTIDGYPIEADFNMRAMAYAVNAETLEGKSQTDFLNVNLSQGMTQANAESIFNRFTKLDAILNNFDNSGNNISANITGNAATATTATTATSATTAGNVTGIVAVANGGTGASTSTAARTNLGLGTLSTLSPTGTADNTTYLRGDGTWSTVPGGSVSYGTTAGTAAEGNDSRITGAFQSATALNGDLSGTLPSPSVAKINGVAVSSAVAGDDGKFLKFTNGSGWQPQFVKLSELKNSTGLASAFNVGSCTSSQTLVWSSITDQFACQNISITKSQISDFPATIGTVNSVTATAGTPITISGTAADPTVGVSAASTNTNGYLSSADWNTFNNKQSASTELSAVSGISSTGLIKRTGAAAYSTVGVSQPLVDSGTDIGLSLSSTGGLYLSSGSLAVKLGTGLSVDGSNQLQVNFGTTAGTSAQGNDTRIVNAVQTSDARLPASTCASGSFNRWDGSAWVCEADQNSGGGGSGETTVTLTDAATVSFDGSTGFIYNLTVAGDRTIANPTNVVDGRIYRIFINQDATGSRVLTWGTNWMLNGILNLAPAALANSKTGYIGYGMNGRIYITAKLIEGCGAANTVMTAAGNGSLIVPNNCTKMTVYAWGGGGGSGGGSSYSGVLRAPGAGGGGAYAFLNQATVTSGETLTYYVGGGGGAGGAGNNPTTAAGGTNGGGSGASGATDGAHASSGGGGGYSGISRGATLLVVAGGGGGSGGANYNSTDGGGAGGGGGEAGYDSGTTVGGPTGNQATSSGQAGQASTGSNGAGGGGGGGYLGGGRGVAGAGANNINSGGSGGGGGSSYTTIGATEAAVGSFPANSGSQYYAGPAGSGGAAPSPGNNNGTAGSPGRIVIVWE